MEDDSYFVGAKKHAADGNNRDKVYSVNNIKQTEKATLGKEFGSMNQTAEEESTPLPSPTAYLMQQQTAGPLRKADRSGTISEVYLENFMCHRKLTIKLCDNINFIAGQNGSGKSAILVAIQVCLGAGARRTNRARNLKDLVRKESGEYCSGARIRVTLLNRGVEAFKHQKYGDKIIVERRISLRKGGYDGYKLLGEGGDEHSRSKIELNNILEHFNILVENPLACLDQEAAKSFCTGLPEDKYIFFMKATELESLDHRYAAIQDNILQQEETEQRARDAIRDSIRKTKLLKREWEKFKELDRMEAQRQKLRADYGWALHNELKGSLEEKLKETQEHGRALDELKSELEKTKKVANCSADEEIQLKNQLLDLVNESNEAAENKSNLEQNLKKIKTLLMEKKRKKEMFVKEKALASNRLIQGQKRLEGVRKQILEAAGDVTEEERIRVDKTSKVESNITSVTENIESFRFKIDKHLRHFQEMEQPLAHAKETRQRTEYLLRKARSRISDLQAHSGKKEILIMYGPKCKALYDCVQKAVANNEFKGPVVGPVGMHIGILEGKGHYAKIAELAIGRRNLERFVVTNSQDLELMKKLKREVGCKNWDCPLYQIHVCATKQKYRIPSPPDGIETVASVLCSNSAMTFNFLVDFCTIDNIALADSKEKSEAALLVTNANGREFIRGNVKKVYFLPDGDFWEMKGESRMMVSNDQPLKQTIGIDRTDAIECARREAKELETELSRNTNEEESIIAKISKSKHAWNEAKKNCETASEQLKQLQLQLEELRAEAETSAGIPSIDTSEYENDVRESTMAVEELKTKVASIDKDIVSIHPKIDEKERKLEEVKARNEKLLDDLEKAESKLENIVKGKSYRMEQVEKLKERVNEHKDALEVREEDIKEIKPRVKRALDGARKMQYQAIMDCKRLQGNGANDHTIDESSLVPSNEELESIEVVVPQNDSEYYKAKIIQKDNQIKAERERRELVQFDPVATRENYLHAKKTLDSKIEQIQAIEANVKDLKQDLKKRFKMWMQFRAHLAEQISVTFNDFLMQTGRCGEVEFDHDTKQMNVVFHKDIAIEGHQTKDVKALSGGERSSVTLSLLLAIGESLETPFRVMDEFDVFLDPDQRSLALRLLINVARDLKTRQFIFITPQDLSNVIEGPDLKIIEMRPPARRQTVGGAQQMTITL